MIGLRRGWAALLEHDPDDPASAEELFLPLDPGWSARSTVPAARSFTRRARTRRVRPKAVPGQLAAPYRRDGPRDFTAHALRAIESLGIDALIPIGGDDTLSYGLRMHDEGVPVIAIPKTMDNDVHGHRLLHRLLDRDHPHRALHPPPAHDARLPRAARGGRAVRALQRRNLLIAAYLAGVDRAIISEVPFDIDKLARFLVQDKPANPRNYAMVTISEGATLAGGEMVQSGAEDAFGGTGSSAGSVSSRAR